MKHWAGAFRLAVGLTLSACRPYRLARVASERPTQSEGGTTRVAQHRFGAYHVGEVESFESLNTLCNS